MQKLLYLTVWDFQDAASNGICKKILSQVKTLKELGFQVDFGYTKKGEVYLQTGEENIFLGRVPVSLNIMLAHVIFAKKLRNEKYDAIYIRHCVSSPFYIYLLATLKKKCSKIVVELPTYPYDNELKGDIKLQLGGYLDKMTRGRMEKYVSRIVTYSNHDSIFSVPTIKTINGVDFSSIPQTKKKWKKGEIHLIAVAMLSPWHGYDRVIKGLHGYYQEKRETMVKFHIVGNGKELGSYKDMVEKWNLQSYVEFYGNQAGEELNKIYQKADMAVSSLGLHRIGLESASTLKDREYGARGLLMISSHQIDFFDENSPYVYYIPADESPVDIQKVVEFYEHLANEEKLDQIGREIREITRKSADMSATFQPIKDFFREERKK